MLSEILFTIEAFVAHFGLGILLILGLVGNLLVILILRQYRKNTCFIYLSTASLMNIIYLMFNTPLSIYSYFYMNFSPYTLIFCKLHFYYLNIFAQISRYFCILACFDQYIFVNMNYHLQYINQPTRAKRLVVFVIIFCSLMGIHQITLTTIYNQQCTEFGIYYSINVIYSLLSFPIIPAFLMITISYLTYHRIQQSGKWKQKSCSVYAGCIIRQRDRALLRMIFGQVLIYLLTSVLHLVIGIELLVMVSKNYRKSYEYIQKEKALMMISIFLININHTTPFYHYFIVSKRFRQDFKNLITKSRANVAHV